MDLEVNHRGSAAGTAGHDIETLAVLVRFWLAATPALPKPAAVGTPAKAAERCESFVTAFGGRLAKGPKLRQGISKNINPMDDGGSAMKDSGCLHLGDDPLQAAR